MSEEDVRGGLREAVADEPPLDFDPDAVVATAKQQAKRRRSLVAVGVATVAVAVAAVALPSTLGRESTRAADQPPPPAPMTTSPTPFQWPPADVTPAHYTPDELRTRSEKLANYLKDTLPAALPTATDFTFGAFGGEAVGDFYEGQTSVNAADSFTIGGARYSIVVTVWVPGIDEPSPTTLCSLRGTDCRQFGEQDGGPLITATDDSDGRIITSVAHFRRTGAMVEIAAYNYDVASTGTVKYMPTVPMTLDQLVRLATARELAL